MSKRIIALGLFGLLSLFAVRAAAVETTYVADTSSGTYRSVITAADTTNLRENTLPVIQTAGKPAVRISPRFAANGGTAVLICVRGIYQSGNWTRIQGITSVASICSSSMLDEDSRFVAEDVAFDVGGASHVKIMVRSLQDSGGAATTLTLVQTRH